MHVFSLQTECFTNFPNLFFPSKMTDPGKANLVGVLWVAVREDVYVRGKMQFIFAFCKVWREIFLFLRKSPRQQEHVDCYFYEWRYNLKFVT